MKKISTVIAPSKWMADLAKESFIFKNKKIFQIPYPLDMKIFFPENSYLTRKN